MEVPRAALGDSTTDQQALPHQHKNVLPKRQPVLGRHGLCFRDLGVKLAI